MLACPSLAAWCRAVMPICTQGAGEWGVWRGPGGERRVAALLESFARPPVQGDVETDAAPFPAIILGAARRPGGAHPWA